MKSSIPEMDANRVLSRRRFVGVIGAGVVIGASGCLDDGEEVDDDLDNGEQDEPNDGGDDELEDG